MTSSNRRGRRHSLLLLASLPWVAWAGTPDVVAKIRARLVSAPLLRGEFEQRKTVKGFKRPLVSRGDFLVMRQRGVVWRTREPVASALVLTRDMLVSRNADGSIGQQLDASREPAVRGITELMFAVLSADLAVLGQRFQIEGELRGNEGWHLTLTPREAALAQWASRIDIEGDRFVRRVEWREALGDVSVIHMSQHQTLTAPSKDEEAWLG